MKTVRQQAKDKGHPVIGSLKRGADDVYSKNGEVIRNRIYIDDEGTVYAVNWRGAGLTRPPGEWRKQTMTNDEMKRAVDLLAEYARTGLLCVSGEEAELLRRFARTMEEWGK